MKKDVVLFHGDFDGIASAALVIGLFRPASYETFCCEPFGVNKALRRFGDMKAAGLDPGRLYSVDVAPNNKCMAMTAKFLAGCASIFSSIELFDHHNGWEGIETPPCVARHIDPSFRSCAALIYSGASEKSDFFDLITADADIIDSGGCEGVSPGSFAVYRALKANLRDDGIKMKALEYMVSGYGDEALRETIEARAAAYDEMLERSMAAIDEKLVELTPRICYIDVGDGAFDITAIIMRCYRRYPFVIVEYRSGGTVFNVIATKLDRVDLVRALGLRSGSRFRVTVTRRERADIVSALEGIDLPSAEIKAG